MIIINIKGIVDTIKFYNYKNYFAIFNLKTEDNNIVSCKGNIPLLVEGLELLLKGDYQQDKLYGDTFMFNKYDLINNKNNTVITGILKMIPGIGKQTIESIQQHFGNDIYYTIKNNPDKLLEINNIGKQKVENIRKFVNNIFGTIDVFNSIGTIATPKQIFNVISKEYNKGNIDIVDELTFNPYRLVEFDFSVNARTIDYVIKQNNIELDSIIREYQTKAYLMDILKRNHSTYAVFDDIQKQLAKPYRGAFKRDPEDIKRELRNLSMADELIYDESTGKLKPTFLEELEKNIAQVLNRINSVSTAINNFNNLLQNTDGYQALSGEQKEAVINSIQNTISIVTGGPGTGKSHVISIINKFFNSIGKKVLLLAPTGKAAMRLGEIDKEAKAMTIHLALQIYKKGFDFDVIIVDEMSMVDLELLDALLENINIGTKLILVGDPMQLAPVGYGEPFNEIIRSDIFKISKLSHIFRQDLKDISELANAALNGNTNNFVQIMNSSKVISYVKTKYTTSEAYTDLITNVFIAMLKRYGLEYALKNSLILTPIKNKDKVGTFGINQQIALLLNKNRKIHGFNIEFKTGDKVINEQNDYDKNVMNGEIGYVGVKNFNETWIKFNNERIEYKNWEMNDINLAYAITVHKSQGSEANHILLPLYKQHYPIWTKRMMYTAITRAKKHIIFVGSDFKTGGYQNIHLLLNGKEENKIQMDLTQYIKDYSKLLV